MAGGNKDGGPEGMDVKVGMGMRMGVLADGCPGDQRIMAKSKCSRMHQVFAMDGFPQITGRYVVVCRSGV